MKNQLIFCYVLVAISAVSAIDYCNMNCTVNGTEIGHIACGKKEEFGSDCPLFAELAHINDTLQHVFLNQINKLRNDIAGGMYSTHNYSPACRMATVQWDNELANHAAVNSKKCKKQRDFCHRTFTIPNPGQLIFETNLAESDGIDKALTYAINVWTIIIHAQQFGDLLADQNIRLGCAITYAPAAFRLLIDGELQYMRTYWVVCNTATNIHDRESMYEVCNTPAEKCTRPPIAAYPSLCPVEEIYAF